MYKKAAPTISLKGLQSVAGRLFGGLKSLPKAMPQGVPQPIDAMAQSGTSMQIGATVANMKDVLFHMPTLRAALSHEAGNVVNPIKNTMMGAKNTMMGIHPATHQNWV